MRKHIKHAPIAVMVGSLGQPQLGFKLLKVFFVHVTLPAPLHLSSQ